MDYVLPDDLNFNEYIDHAFSRYKVEKTTKVKTCDEIAADKDKKPELFTYQKLLQAYLSPDTPYRGCLVYHQLGSGKTLTAIGVAENQNRDVIVMLPSSLKQSWFEEIMAFRGYKIPKNATEAQRKKLMQEFEDEIKKKYTFISSNASNSAEQLEFMEERKLGKMKTSDFEDVDYIISRMDSKSGNPLDGKFLIIDESHRIMTNIINAESKNGIRIYDTIMDAKDLRLMFLTATPLIGNPYESAVMFNMLRGYMKVEGSNQLFTAFPKEYDQFMDYFVDLDTNSIKNKHIFQERIYGLVSYYRGLYDPDNKVIPRENSVNLIKVEMSDYQWKAYAYYRKEEMEEEKKSKFATEKFVKLEYKKPGRKSFTTYRMATRQICNFVLPKDLKRPKYKKSDSQSLRKKIDNQLIEQIPVDIVTKKLDIYSPKMKKILDMLTKTKKGIAFIYSNFITLGGLGVLAHVMKNNGYMMYTGRESPSTFEVPAEYEYKVFALLTGETQSNYYQNVLKFLNDPKNKEGKYCRALLASSVVAEGINLRNIRQVHIMEPDWRQTRLDQVIGRAFRLCSHNDLPQAERSVDIYIYLMKAPAGLPPSKTLGEDTDLTTDEYIYYRAQENKKLLDKFLLAMKEVAFDCELNFAHNYKKGDLEHCDECVDPEKYKGKGKKVYLPNIAQQIIPGNSYCLPQRKTAKLMPVTIDGKQYFIDADKNVYECDAKKVCKPVGVMQGKHLQIRR